MADVYLVMARTGAQGAGGVTAFVVEKGAPGLAFGAPERKMGWHAQPTASVSFDRVRVPASSMLGPPGGGFAIAMAALDGGRVNIAACSVGGAARAVDAAAAYARERKQFGRRIADFQGVGFKLADAATAVQTARLMTR